MRCVFHSRSHAPDGWLDAYTVDLEAPDFRVSAPVGNPGHGFPPSVLFGRLAAQWTGWTGDEAWRSTEGEFVITARSDRTGHVHLTFALSSSYWSTSASVSVEAGQLERLARGARAFFEDGD